MKKMIIVLMLTFCMVVHFELVEAGDDINKDFISVFAVWDCTIGIKTDGTIRAIGYNADEIEKIFDSKGPFVDFAGSTHVIGLTADGNTTSYQPLWDEEKFNQCGPYTSIADGIYYITGLKGDGTVLAESKYMNENELLFPWDNIVDMCELQVSFYPRVCGLKSDGTVLIAREKNKEYAFENTPENFKDIIRIEGAYDLLVGLKKDGTITAYDFLSGKEIVLPWKDIIDIAVSSSRIYALKKDGTVLGYFTSVNSEIDMSGWSDIISISASDSHLVALRKDGKVLARGNNEYGQCNVESWDLTPLAGDANDDNEVNAKDALAILRVAAQMDDFGTEFLPGKWSPENAKLTKGTLEEINAKDALEVLKIAAKIK